MTETTLPPKRPRMGEASGRDILQTITELTTQDLDGTRQFAEFVEQTRPALLFVGNRPESLIRLFASSPSHFYKTSSVEKVLEFYRRNEVTNEQRGY